MDNFGGSGRGCSGPALWRAAPTVPRPASAPRRTPPSSASRSTSRSSPAPAKSAGWRGGTHPARLLQGRSEDRGDLRRGGWRALGAPRDYAMVEADGTITLLGRGSACINSGGEKIYPEEVEAAVRPTRRLRRGGRRRAGRALGRARDRGRAAAPGRQRHPRRPRQALPRARLRLKCRASRSSTRWSASQAASSTTNGRRA